MTVNIFRLIAAALAFVICASEGSRRSRALKERSEFTAEIQSMIERFSVGIRYSAKNSDELLDAENGRFARMVKSFKEQTNNTRLAWEMACSELPQYPDETAVLRELGASFGTMDTDNTLRLLECCQAEISSLKNTAEAEYSKRGKAVFQVGALCGIGAAILII